MTIRVTNAGPDPDTVHVLPTAWFRNTWSWDFHGDTGAGLGASHQTGWTRCDRGLNRRRHGAVGPAGAILREGRP
jgi:hypothetical protein